MSEVASQEASDRRGGKSAAAFRTITEVAAELDLPQHVLRFWETKFPQVKPLKRAGGRRYYRPEDVKLLRRIRTLLHEDGYTIKGVQKLLRQNAGKLPDDIGAPPPETESRDVMVEVESAIEELEELRAQLNDALTNCRF